MLSLRSVIRRLVFWFYSSIVFQDVLCLLLPEAAQTGRPGQAQRWRPEMRQDAYPAPVASEQDVFSSRVLQWHVLYCGKSRVCSDHVTSSCYMCAPCHCDLSCGNFGDCCPDLVMETGGGELQRPFTGRDSNIWSCKSTAIQQSIPEYNNKGTAIQQSIPEYNTKSSSARKRRSYPTSQPPVSFVEARTQNYLMISSCPPAFTDDSSLCENSENLAPVSAKDDSLKVFRNIHCALCHDVLETVSWNIRISCEGSKNLTNLYTARDVVTMSMSQSDCAVVYVPSSSEHGRKCYSDPEIISRCNVTGKWSKRDSFLERACHAYLTPKLVNRMLYKNVFCYMCNHGDEPETQMLLKSCQKKPLTWSPTLEVTLRDLDLSRPKADDPPFGNLPYKVCSKRGIYDHTEESCREVTCEDGHQLVSGTCQPMFSTVRGLGYELYFGLRPIGPIDVAGDHGIIHRLPTEIEVYLGQTILQGKVKLQDFAMSFNTTDNDGRCSQTSSDLAVYVRLVSHGLSDQSQLQRELLQVRHATFNITVHAWNMSFDGFPSEAAWHVMHPSRRQSPQTLSSCVVIVSNTRLEQRRDGTMRVGTTTPDPVTSSESQQPSYIRLSGLLDCPHVELQPHEYSATSPGNALTLKWGLVLPSNRFIMDLEGNVTVCLHDFVEKLGKSRAVRSSQEDTLAIVLLSVSVACLLASFLVFVVFHVLRSLPGKNNMVLLVCLCFSQISVLIGYLVDDAGRMCALVGVAAHYFSLSVFCSLTVSSYHVYTIFSTMHLSRDVTRDRKSLVSYCCFIFLVPLSVIATVVAMHASHKLSWRTFGYGGGGGPFCLLTSSISLWLGVFLPAGVSLVSATALFCFTCSTLHNSTDVETNQTDERHVHFYFRTSLLASVTWLIGVPGIVTSIAPLRITFIVLASVLGVYVFVSLVLTPRVARLLSGACCQGRQPPRGRTSLNMKMASADDCPVKPPCIVGTGYRRRDLNGSGVDSRRNPQERYTKKTDFVESSA